MKNRLVCGAVLQQVAAAVCIHYFGEDVFKMMVENGGNIPDATQAAAGAQPTGVAGKQSGVKQSSAVSKQLLPGGVLTGDSAATSSTSKGAQRRRNNRGAGPTSFHESILFPFQNYFLHSRRFPRIVTFVS